MIGRSHHPKLVLKLGVFIVIMYGLCQFPVHMVLAVGDELSSKGHIRVIHCCRLQILQLLLLFYMFFGCCPWDMNYHTVLIII